MRDPTLFDHRRDPVLGEALRRALDPEDGEVGNAAFVARVLALAAEVPAPSWDHVLARWARAGVAAAILVAVAAGYFVGRAGVAAPAPRPTMTDVLLSPPAHPREVEIVLTSVIDNQ